jgi:glucose/arabinose dehydrogenase
VGTLKGEWQMKRTWGLAVGVVAVALAAVALGFGREQARPEGMPPLLKYHIKPGDLPPPSSGVANPPEVVDKPADASLQLPAGFKIDVFSDTGFETLRNLIEGPNGDLFAADVTTNTITLLRDTNNDGKADERQVFAQGLDRPYGMAISNGFFYVGNTNSIVRWKYAPGQTKVEGAPQKIADVPGGGNHWTRSLAFKEDGSKLYVAIGSESNVDVEPSPRASILEMNPDGSGRRVFGSGIRNPVGLAVRPGTTEVWAGVHERDMLGDDLVPDYVTRVQDGGFYGWPFAYIGPNVDPRHKGERPELVKKTLVPDVLLQSHSAPMGLAFYTGTQFPAEYRGDAFLALHGSWNRKQRTGYKVVRIPVRDGKPTGGYEDFIVGWSLGEGQSRVWGRPVAIVVRKDGSMLITDDAHNVIWRVTYGG